MNKNEVRMRAELESALHRSGSISTRDAVELLNVSESTVRRIFGKMEADGDAIRIFGGIRLSNAANQYQYDVTMERQRRVKTQIGKLAASMVSDNDFIYIDCGTTTIHLCQFLVERLDRGELTAERASERRAKAMSASPMQPARICSAAVWSGLSGTSVPWAERHLLDACPLENIITTN